MYKGARRKAVVHCSFRMGVLLALCASCWRERVVVHDRVVHDRAKVFIYKPCIASWNDPPLRPCIVYSVDDRTCDRSERKIVCDDPTEQQQCELEAWRDYGSSVSWWVEDAWPRCAHDE
jgi:hypothetical protein